MARRDVEFNAEGVTLRGWFYAAGTGGAPAPAVAMAHGFSAVKEMYLDSFAEVFAAAGLNVLVFDNRNFGASDGEPRQEIDPWDQVRDYRHAITYAGTLPEVAAGRIGIWAAVTPAAMCWWGRTSSPGSAGSSRPTVSPASTASYRSWCRWWTRTRWRPRRCRPQTRGSGSPRPARRTRRPGATR